MPLAQKVFIVKYFYKLGEDLDNIWEAFQSEYKMMLHPEEAAELFPQIINAFETSGSVVSDFYYRKAAGKDTTKAEIMYSSVQDVIEETVIEADDRPVIIIEGEEEEMIEEDEEQEDEEEEEAEVLMMEEPEEMIEAKMEPHALIIGESTEDTQSSEASSGSESDQSETDTDVSFKPTPRKVIIRPIKHHGQLDQENTPQPKNLTGKRDRKPRRRSPQKFCDICKKFIRSCFAEHMATHSTTKDFVCETCNKSFTTVRYLKEHVQTHQEGKFVCEICGKASKTKSNHNSHSKIHTGERKYHCTMCHLKFLRPQGLKRHMLTHTGEKPYKCRHCNQEFALFMTHQMHERLHTGERPYQCHHCEKSFIGAPALNVSIFFGKQNLSTLRLTSAIEYRSLADAPEKHARK